MEADWVGSTANGPAIIASPTNEETAVRLLFRIVVLRWALFEGIIPCDVLEEMNVLSGPRLAHFRSRKQCAATSNGPWERGLSFGIQSRRLMFICFVTDAGFIRCNVCAISYQAMVYTLSMNGISSYLVVKLLQISHRAL